MTNHYNVKYWQTFEDYWIDHQPVGPPTDGRYYDTRLEAARKAAKRAVDNGSVQQSMVTTTSGETVYMVTDCGQLGTCWLDHSDEIGG
jgi:hypothetical protein